VCRGQERRNRDSQERVVHRRRHAVSISWPPAAPQSEAREPIAGTAPAGRLQPEEHIAAGAGKSNMTRRVAGASNRQRKAASGGAMDRTTT
jgi:hypothetical protein